MFEHVWGELSGQLGGDSSKMPSGAVNASTNLAIIVPPTVNAGEIIREAGAYADGSIGGLGIDIPARYASDNSYIPLADEPNWVFWGLIIALGITGIVIIRKVI